MSHRDFEEQLKRAYMRESQQVQLYAVMADLAPNEVYRQTMLRFQQDQMRNVQYLGSLLSATSLGQSGGMPGERPRSFLEAIRRARIEQLEEVESLDELSRMAPTAATRAGLWWVMRDQVEHFLFFSYTEDLLEAEGQG